MGYRDHLDRPGGLAIRSSETESCRSGLTIGRLNVGPPGFVRGRDVVQLIERSEFDVVIVRASAEDTQLASELNTSRLISWQADTLLYFQATSRLLAAGSTPDRLVRLGTANAGEVDELIQQIFANYKNHYSSNPALSQIDVVAAYQEWARTALSSDSSAVTKSVGPDGSPVGLCVTDVGDESHVEIQLAGVVPDQRGRGAYQTLLRGVGQEAYFTGKESVVISTQAANTRVLRAWCRLGFLPSLALNTIHVVRKEILPAAWSDSASP